MTARAPDRLPWTAGTGHALFWLSIFLFVVAFGLEGALLFFGFAVGISGELVGRVMGTVDTLAVMVGTFWFGTSRSSQNSEALLYQSTPANGSSAGKDKIMGENTQNDRPLNDMLRRLLVQILIPVLVPVLVGIGSAARHGLRDDGPPRRTGFHAGTRRSPA